MLKSKLKNGYSVSDPDIYLYGDSDGLDPVFAGRLAYLAKVSEKKFKITSGYRSSAEQERLYALYKSGKLQSAAKPGKSWHEFHLAADISTYPVRGMSNSELKPYGLCKPISSEGWHIQAIETLGQTDRNKFAPEEEEEVKVEEITVEMNGKETKLNTIFYNDENYVRIRDLADAQSEDAFSVAWDSKRKKVIIKSR